MKHYNLMLIAGEASGDLLAAELIQAFRQLPEVQSMPWPPKFFGAGGPRMADAGVELLIDLTAHSVFGLTEALAQYGKFKSFFHALFQEAVQRQPEVIVLVDFGGFNLRFAAAIKRHIRKHAGPFNVWNPRIVYYVSPQVWASRPGRAYRVAGTVDLLLSIFPFEKDWYATRVPWLRVEFAGHPLMDRHANAECGVGSAEFAGASALRTASQSLGELPSGSSVPPHPGPLPQGEEIPLTGSGQTGSRGFIQPRRTTLPLPKGEGRGEGEGGGVSPAVCRTAEETNPATPPSSRPLIVLLPGSRKREIEAHWPVISEAVRIILARHAVRLRLVLPNLDLAEFAARLGAPMGHLEVRTKELAESLSEASLAIASSGTVTLECALFRVPTVVIYKTSWLTYQIARRIITVKHIAMPNLLAGETVYPELIQNDAKPADLAREALEFLNNPSRVAVLKSKLSKAVESLGAPGASRRAAEAVLGMLPRP